MRELLLGLAKKHSLPVVFNQSDYAKLGGLLSYGTDIVEVYRQVGIYTGRILKGAKVQDLPVHFPKKIRLVVNLKRARELGLKLPPSLLARADSIIE